MTLPYGVQIKVSQIAGKLDIGFAISADWNRRKQMNKQEAIKKNEQMGEYERSNIRPYDIGYRIVSKNGNIFASKNGASVFSLSSEAKKAIQKEFGKDDPNFDIGRHKIEEVAIVNFEKLKKFLEEVEDK